jgi:hypothetical protein
MGRPASIVASALAWIPILAAEALAPYPPSKEPPTPPGPDTGIDGPAFTGIDVTLGMVILVTLVALGAVLLLLARRRRASAIASTLR